MKSLINFSFGFSQMIIFCCLAGCEVRRANPLGLKYLDLAKIIPLTFDSFFV